MGFVEAVTTCFEKYATFNGRARRSEYWFFFLFGVAVSFVTGLFDFALTAGESHPVTGLFVLATFLPNLAVTVRRYHDIDKTGWWILFPGGVWLIAMLMMLDGPILGLIGLLAALISAIVVLSWMSKKGSFGPNSYGPDPIERFVAPEAGRPSRPLRRPA
jgi:uncharacterized membrane protein YhaH (DUF805 family)